MLGAIEDRETEVEELHLFIRSEYQVLQLDIPVTYPLVMQVCHGIQQLTHDLDGFGLRYLLCRFLDIFIQRYTLHILCDEVHVTVCVDALI